MFGAEYRRPSADVPHVGRVVRVGAERRRRHAGAPNGSSGLGGHLTGSDHASADGPSRRSNGWRSGGDAHGCPPKHSMTWLGRASNGASAHGRCASCSVCVLSERCSQRGRWGLAPDSERPSKVEPQTDETRKGASNAGTRRGRRCHRLGSKRNDLKGGERAVRPHGRAAIRLACLGIEWSPGGAHVFELASGSARTATDPLRRQREARARVQAHEEVGGRGPVSAR